MNASAQRRAIEEATAALAHRLYERDQLPPEERPDPRAEALSFMHALHGHGWRYTNAQRSPWVSKPIRDNSDAYARGAAMARELLERGPAHHKEEEQS